jgi:hypothetical protein
MSICGQNFPLSIIDKSLCRIDSAPQAEIQRWALLRMRSSVNTAICSKPLGPWMYGDWIALAESRHG